MSKPGKRSGKRAWQEKSSSFDYSSADNEIRVVNGRHEVHIVNLGFHQTSTDRHQRLTSVSRQEDFPDLQILQKLLVEEPDKYLPCTLRDCSPDVRRSIGYKGPRYKNQRKSPESFRYGSRGC